MDTWLRWLHEFDADVFVWQTSHVGATINDWPDKLADEIAQTGDLSDPIELLPARYASIEIAAGGPDTKGGQITRGGVRSWAVDLLSELVTTRLRVTSKLTQSRSPDDLYLPRLAPSLEDKAEQLLAGRLQLGDARRLRGRSALALLKEAGHCPFGCGCGFSWWDVAFVCQGAEVVEQRTVWLACVREARVAVTCGEPQPEWMQLVSLIDGSARESLRDHDAGPLLLIALLV